MNYMKMTEQQLAAIISSYRNNIKKAKKNNLPYAATEKILKEAEKALKDKCDKNNKEKK